MTVIWIKNNQILNVNFPNAWLLAPKTKKHPALTLAELQIHPSDNLLLPTNPVTSVLNQHRCQCLSNWVMVKHTRGGTRWLLRYADRRVQSVLCHCKYLYVCTCDHFCMHSEWYCASTWDYLCWVDQTLTMRWPNPTEFLLFQHKVKQK